MRGILLNLIETDRSAAESRYFGAAVLLLVVVLVGIAAIVYPGPAKTTSSTTTSSTATGGFVVPTNVTVFGLVSTTGAGTHPVSMVFTSQKYSMTFVAPVSAGRFSIQLPNQETYNVTMRWSGNFTWQQSVGEVGSLSLNMSAGSMAAESYNTVMPTPDSVVVVNGTVPWSVVTTSPINIRFTANDGENFVAPVSADHSFSIRLPNLMNYEIYIQSQNSTGYRDWFYAHGLQVEVGVGVVGLFVRISS